MREKIVPWLPAIYCAVLAMISTVENLWVYSHGGPDGSPMMVFMLFMPMCFFFVGASLTQLRNANREMLVRLDALEAAAKHD